MMEKSEGCPSFGHTNNEGDNMNYFALYPWMIETSAHTHLEIDFGLHFKIWSYFGGTIKGEMLPEW